LVAPRGDDQRAGDVYASLISSNLERQAERKSSVEQRGLSVISTSGALVTLQFALVAVITGDDSFSFSRPEKAALGTSLLLFVVASVLGLPSNQTQRYPYISSDQLEKFTKPDAWLASSDAAARRVAAAQVSMLRSARKKNGTKAKLLRYAIFVEVAAVAALAACVGLILA
jgi:hypothetical protein